MLGESEPCRVLKTSTPVSAARIPMRAVSSSRISPIMTTSGSCRSMARKPSLNPISPWLFTCDWLMPGIRYSIGIFDRHHVAERRVDAFQAVVKRRGLAGANGSGHEHGAIGLADQAIEHLGLLLAHSQVGEADDRRQDLMDPDHDLLAVDGREGGQAKVAGPVMVHDRDPAVLRVAALDDVEIRHHLEPADHGRGDVGINKKNILKLAVDPVSDSQAGFLGIEVDVGGAAFEGAFQNLGDQVGQGAGVGQLLKVLADITVVLGAIGQERVRRGRHAGLPRRPGAPGSPAMAVSRSKASSLRISGEISASSRIDWRRSRWCSWP